MTARSIQFVFIIGFALMVGACSRNEPMRQEYPIQPVSFEQVQIQDQFWSPRIRVDIEKTIPFAFQNCEETGRVKNFEIAGGRVAGTFCTIYPFDDTDVYKVIEGASYALQVTPDPDMEAYLDTLITKIGEAQEPDGYLYTNRTIDPDSTHDWAGSERWQFVHELSHELYNAGHLYEAAVAHYQATGKRTLLDIALKNADLVDQDFGPGKIERVPGHQVIEMGLVKLYRATGEQKYLDLAKFFLDARGPGGDPYSQAHEKVIDQSEAVGHAVRAGYMYAGMADVAALTGDAAYVNAIDRIWEDVVATKLYVTGGIGSSSNNEGFGEPYDLGNMSAYSETCASIANVFWNHRLFLMRGDARYIDVMERTLYNALLAGVSLSGDRFFYPNPLASNGQHERKPWFGCACCPSNISRFLPSVPGYIYAHTDDAVYVNLFVSSEARFPMPSGEVVVQQESNYPWEGEVTFRLTPEQAQELTLFVRIPGWAREEPVPSDLYRFEEEQALPVHLAVNGETVSAEVKEGYARIKRMWKAGDEVTLSLPMPVRKVRAHEQVQHDAGRFALQKGPLVFTVEGKDQADERVLHLLVSPNAGFVAHHEPDLLEGVDVVTFEAQGVRRGAEGNPEVLPETRMVKAIPYYAWANRGPGQMLVWLPDAVEHTTPLPASTLAYRSEATASADLTTTAALSDQYEPLHSDDHSYGFLHWWPRKNTTQWVQYDFPEATTVSSSEVYWFDDRPHGGCRIPAGWRLLYRDGKAWKPVNNLTPYNVTKDAFDTVQFAPVRTTALRLEVNLPEAFSTGIHEWAVR